jgi:hypothetical protein
MSQIKFLKAFTLSIIALSFVACSNGNNPTPLANRTVTDEGGNGTPEVKSLFQKVLENGVPEVPLRKAFDYFDAHKNIIKNQKYMSIIDFSQNSKNKRYYLIDLQKGLVDKILVAHGRASDPDHDGNATKFSNAPGSNMTSLGFMLTGERYIGEHGVSLRLDGLESLNSNVRKRAIVIHGADYVTPDLPVLGRSLGCPAVEPRLIVSLVKNIENGSLVYSYYSGL